MDRPQALRRSGRQPPFVRAAPPRRCSRQSTLELYVHFGVPMTSGAANGVFAKIMATMPASEGPAVKADAAISQTRFCRPSAASLLPLHRLADDPALLRNRRTAGPHQADHRRRADIASFAKLYPMNARPMQ